MPIIFSDLNGKDTLILPFDPPVVKVVRVSANETVSTIEKNIRVSGNSKLYEVSWDSFFPVKNYKFLTPGCRTNPMDYISFIEKNRNKKSPIRVVASNPVGFSTLIDNPDSYKWNDIKSFPEKICNNVLVLNRYFTIDKFNQTTIDQNNDIHYSIMLTEFPMTDSTSQKSTLKMVGQGALTLAFQQTKRHALRAAGLI